MSGALARVGAMPSASHPLLRGLVDDAALFPPGNAPMAEALREHEEMSDEPWAEAMGLFVCPASRADELLATQSQWGSVLVSVLADTTAAAAMTAVRTLKAARRSLPLGLEASLSRLGADAAPLAHEMRDRSLMALLGYLEVPRDDVAAGLDLVGAEGWHCAKYRTGGETPDAFPTEDELARFIATCVDQGKAFKLTAGLHHAVRNRSAEGFEQHGVLNVLVAVYGAIADRRAGRPADRDEAADTLDDRDGAWLAKEVRSWTRAEATAVRRTFRSFGCCGVREPIDELRALSVLEDDEH
jgi:hypothetical protein